MSICFITFFYILSVNTLDISEVINTVHKNSHFETVFVLGSVENFNFEYPRLIYSKNGSTFPLKLRFSKKILTIINETELLDSTSVFLKGNLESKVLVISLNFKDTVEKCRVLNLQDAVIYSFGEFYIHKAFSNYAEKSEEKNIFKTSLFNGFEEHLITITDDNLWESCKIFDYCMLITSFAKDFNFEIANFLVEDLKTPTIQVYSFKSLQNYVYPMYLEMSTVTIMTPLNPKVDRFYYYIIPFECELWIGIISTILIFSTILTVLEFSRNGKLDFPKNFLKSLALTIHGGGLDISNDWKIYWMHGMMIGYGFVLMNVYLQFLGVYFITDASFIQEIDTLCLEELLQVFKQAFDDDRIKSLRLKETAIDTYFDNIHSLRTDYGYCISSALWDKKLVFQAYLKRPIFKKMDHVIAGYFPRSPLFREDTIFLKLFNEYILKMHAHGFMHKWSKGMVLSNYRQALIEFYLDRGGPAALNVEDLRFAWTLYLGGVVLGILQFVIELVWLKVWNCKRSFF